MFGLPSLYGMSKDIAGFGAASDKIPWLARVQFK